MPDVASLAAAAAGVCFSLLLDNVFLSKRFVCLFLVVVFGDRCLVLVSRCRVVAFDAFYVRSILDKVGWHSFTFSFFVRARGVGCFRGSVTRAGFQVDAKNRNGLEVEVFDFWGSLRTERNRAGFDF